MATEISSLQKELPKAQPQEIGKACVRYRRGARRRYLKTTPEGGLGEIYASLYLPSRRRCKNIRGWGGQSGHKHLRTDTRTLNLSADHLGKWSKADNQRTNAQVMAGLTRLRLITLACPSRKLGSNLEVQHPSCVSQITNYTADT